MSSAVHSDRAKEQIVCKGFMRRIKVILTAFNNREIASHCIHRKKIVQCLQNRCRIPQVFNAN